MLRPCLLILSISGNLNTWPIACELTACTLLLVIVYNVIPNHCV